MLFTLIYFDSKKKNDHDADDAVLINMVYCEDDVWRRCCGVNFCLF